MDLDPKFFNTFWIPAIVCPISICSLGEPSSLFIIPIFESSVNFLIIHSTLIFKLLACITSSDGLSMDSYSISPVKGIQSEKHASTTTLLPITKPVLNPVSLVVLCALSFWIILLCRILPNALHSPYRQWMLYSFHLLSYFCKNKLDASPFSNVNKSFLFRIVTNNCLAISLSLHNTH